MTAKDSHVFNSDQVNDYLKRLNLNVSKPDLNFLKRIHKAHLLRIPIENLDLFFGHHPRFDILLFHSKIIQSTRGGTTIELNLLFFHLLKSLQYNCWLVSGRKKEHHAAELVFEHPLVLVEIQSQIWIADVGSERLFLEPRQVLPDLVQLDYNQYFRFVTDPDENYILQKSSDGSVFEDAYQFSKASVNEIQFLERYEYHQKSNNSPLKQQKMISKALENGQIILTERQLISITNGKKVQTKLLHEDDFAAKLEHYFGISYDELLYQRLNQ